MKLLTVIFLTTFFLTCVLAEIKQVQTAYFSEHSFHEVEDLNTKFNLGFFIAGYIILGVLLIFAMVRIWVDEWERHKFYNEKVAEAEADLKRLNLDITKIEADF